LRIGNILAALFGLNAGGFETGDRITIANVVSHLVRFTHFFDMSASDLVERGISLKWGKRLVFAESGHHLNEGAFATLGARRIFAGRA